MSGEPGNVMENFSSRKVGTLQYFGSFWGIQGFRDLRLLYYCIKWHLNIIIDIRNLFKYGFRQFWGVYGPLLLKNSIWGQFWAKKGFWGPRLLRFLYHYADMTGNIVFILSKIHIVSTTQNCDHYWPLLYTFQFIFSFPDNQIR